MNFLSVHMSWPTRRAAGALLGAVLLGCGTVETAAFRPPSPRAVSAVDVRHEVENLVARGAAGHPEARPELRRKAEEIEAALLARTPTTPAHQRLRLRALRYAAEYPEAREANAREVLAALEALPEAGD